ncbi:MAG: 16S rRNA (cytidine(1402)-2'-O)-methyltransferase [Giesbergeria sp.]
MSISFASALHAASEVAASQHYPQGALYVVATPIGNLADISLRALHVLQLADCIGCEDTRHTQGLLRSYGIDKTGAQLLSVHQHNEQEAAQAVIARLQQGQRVAYVSDAGTPGISDPGARLVAAVHAAALRTVPVPGASSITTMLSVAGALTHGGVDSGFVFAGFLPTKAGERSAAIESLRGEARCVALLEAPHRIVDLAKALAVLGTREVTLGRELTKQYEDIVTLPADQLNTWLSADSNRTRGEFVVVLHPASVERDNGLPNALLQQLLPLLPLKTAVRIATEITGAPRNALYEAALALRDGEGAGPPED